MHGNVNEFILDYCHFEQLNITHKLDLRRVGPALGIKALFAPTEKTFTGLFAEEPADAIQFQAVTFQLDQYGGDGDGGSDQRRWPA